MHCQEYGTVPLSTLWHGSTGIIPPYKHYNNTMAWYILPLAWYHCQHYGMVLRTISTTYGIVALLTL